MLSVTQHAGDVTLFILKTFGSKRRCGTKKKKKKELFELYWLKTQGKNLTGFVH